MCLGRSDPEPKFQKGHMQVMIDMHLARVNGERCCVFVLRSKEVKQVLPNVALLRNPDKAQLFADRVAELMTKQVRIEDQNTDMLSSPTYVNDVFRTCIGHLIRGRPRFAGPGKGRRLKIPG